MDARRFQELVLNSLWWWVGLLFAIACLGWCIVRLRQWFRDDTDTADDDRRMFLEIQEMYDEGDLSEQEYRSIKGRLMAGKDHASADASKRNGGDVHSVPD